MGRNNIEFEGTIGRDPVLRKTQSGYSLCNFSVANNVQVGKEGSKKEITTWANITIWGKRGEYAADILKKGMAVIVFGRLQTSTYENKSGVKQTSVDIICDDFKTLNYIKRSGNAAPAQSSSADEQASFDNQSPHFSDDDIPF